MMRVKRARGTRRWWGGPRPAPPAWGEVCIRPPRRASPTELNETAPRSKFSEIGDQSLTPKGCPEVPPVPPSTGKLASVLRSSLAYSAMATPVMA